VSPHQQQDRQRQQQGFNNCAKSAIRTFRRAEYRAIGKIAAGTFFTALTAGFGLEASAANSAAQAGIRSAGGRIIGYSAQFRFGQGLAYGAPVIGAFTGTLAVNGFIDSGHNNDVLNQALATCNSLYPQADDSTIGIFVTTY
jgi:hypothetical protein